MRAPDVREMFMATAVSVAVISGLPGAAAAEAPRVAVTLKPVHSIVAGVMAGIAEPQLLMPGGGSPHAYALKPSQARALARAGLVVRVSENLETFLDRPIENLSDNAAVVTLEDIPGLTLYQVREGGVWEDHDLAGASGEKREPHGHRHGKHDDEHTRPAGHAHGEHDTHIWLDPHNARIIASHVAEALSKVWPDHAGAFAANAERLSGRIAALDAGLKASTGKLRGKPYIVFHDAYRYFEERYGLQPAGSITVSPERTPGAKRLLAIRERIDESGSICVFAEPQFEPRLVATVTAGTPARRGVLDPLGASLPEGPDHYFSLMRNLADALTKCLSPKR